MSETFSTVIVWAVQSAGVGAAVLLAGRLGLWRLRNPLSRQRLAASTLAIALAVPLLNLMPRWWSVAPPWKNPDAAQVSDPEARGATRTVAARLELAQVDPEWPLPEAVVDGEPTVVDAPATQEPVPEDETMADVTPIDLPPALHRRGGGAFVPPMLAPHTEAPDMPTWELAWADLGVSLAAVLMLGTAYFLAEFLLGHWTLLRLRSRSKPASGRVTATLDALTAGWRRKPRVLTSETLPSPVCFGVLRPTIVLPKSLASMATGDMLRWTLAHEVEHLRRGDPLTVWAVGLTKSLYFYVPWFWSVKRELQLAQEHLADAAAVRAGGKPVDYAEFLVNLSQGTTSPASRRALPAHGVRAGRSDLYRRVTMVLQETGATRDGARKGWLTVGALLVGAVALSGLGIAQADNPKPAEAAGWHAIALQQDLTNRTGETVFVSGRPVGSYVVLHRDEPAPPAPPKAATTTVRGRVEVRSESEPATVTVRVESGDKPEATRKKLAEAIKAGKTEEALKLLEELDKPKTATRGDLTTKPSSNLPKPTEAPPAEATRALDDQTKALLERVARSREDAMRSLESALARVKDNPEAAAEIEKLLARVRSTLDEAERTMRKAPRAPQATPPLPPAAPLPPPNQFNQWTPGFAVISPPAPTPPAAVAPPAPSFVAPVFAPPAATAPPTVIWDPSGTGGRIYRSTEVQNSFSTSALGLQARPVSESLAEQLSLPMGEGAVITGVAAGSAGEKAGFKKNDILTKLHGKPVTSANLVEIVSKLTENTGYDATVIRKGKPVELHGIEVPAKPKVRTSGIANPFERTAFEQMSVNIDNGKFNIEAKSSEFRYRITGTISDGKPSVDSFVVIDNKGKTIAYPKSEPTPAEHAVPLRTLLQSVGGK